VLSAALQMPDSTSFIEAGPDRRRWMAVLAKAGVAELEAAWASLPDRPAYRIVRGPETGLVMVRGRIGGSGAPFNLGEMTVTRCTVALEDGAASGSSYVAGRSERHATLAAVFDAVLQAPASRAAIEAIEKLAAAQAEARQAAATKVAASRVEFFTMVRE
jgi:alpha-D-ribose 1-methylphosphonate 5-triphosphate synthase subunit PhnG